MRRIDGTRGLDLANSMPVCAVRSAYSVAGVEVESREAYSRVSEAKARGQRFGESRRVS